MIFSSFAAEAIARLQAVQVGHELGLKQVIIEGDSLLLGTMVMILRKRK